MNYSQVGQDRWVRRLFHKKQQGYFVEVGANDGRTFSNTYVLEKELGWQGLCIEPGESFATLKENRTCALARVCVTRRDGEEVQFRIDSEDSLYSGILNTKAAHGKRPGSIVVLYGTSLTSLLKEYAAPKKIEFVSIDTEGSELAVLQGLDFTTYEIASLTIEHNYETEKRHAIYDLLLTQGFIRIAELGYDDFYINKSSFPWMTVLTLQSAYFSRQLLLRIRRFPRSLHRRFLQKNAS